MQPAHTHRSTVAIVTRRTADWRRNSGQAACFDTLMAGPETGTSDESSETMGRILQGILLLSSLLLGACASPPHSPQGTSTAGLRAADAAQSMLGKPYRYGGATPAGFDCSGLVQYSYTQAGVDLPRETQVQQHAGIAVDPRSLQPGDLLFFDLDGKKASHVGIYLGDGRFVHAPSTGGSVRIDELAANYWRSRFREARRL